MPYDVSRLQTRQAAQNPNAMGVQRRKACHFWHAECFMRKLKGLWATGLLCLLLACLTIGVNAKELQFSSFYAYAEADNTATRINATVVGDTTYLILPRGKTATQVPQYF